MQYLFFFFYIMDDFSILILEFIEKYYWYRYYTNKKKLVGLVINNITNLYLKIHLVFISINSLLSSNFVFNYNIHLLNKVLYLKYF